MARKEQMMGMDGWVDGWSMGGWKEGTMDGEMEERMGDGEIRRERLLSVSLTDVRHLGFLPCVKEIMEGFLPGGVAKSKSHFLKITLAALEKKGQKLKPKNPGKIAV